MTAPESLGRRRALQLLGGAGLAAALAACAGKGSDTADPTTSAPARSGTGGAGTTAAGATAAIPEETAGPFPGDGSNGPDVLDDKGVVRSDITRSYGPGDAVAAGVPLTVRLKVTDAAGGVPKPGAAVYVWHCDRDGGYSLYSRGLEDQNYLRGVQAAGDDGVVSFTTIFPGAYPGRWPHIHFEVYDDEAGATGGGKPIATSQLALPEDACRAVYATDGYSTSATNLAGTSLAQDMVFGDDRAVHQLATVSGSVGSGLAAALHVPV